MITFSLPEHLLGVFPEPKKAGKFLPDYYKNLEVETDKDPRQGTAKRCVPFMEAITAGFIIPLWSDLYVVAKDGGLNLSFPDNLPMQESLGHHGYQQLEGHPASDLAYGKDLLKFINPWTIETAPGISCLFTTPMNHFETRFKLVDGVVDTDSYYNPINFPFIWTGGDGEFFIKKGTPLVQVVPFLREDFGDCAIAPTDKTRQQKTKAVLGTTIKNGYRQSFWHKRKETTEE